MSEDFGRTDEESAGFFPIFGKPEPRIKKRETGNKNHGLRISKHKTQTNYMKRIITLLAALSLTGMAAFAQQALGPGTGIVSP